ncbi:hypothetical protein ACRAWD_04385 [Caulobacter segnis]
MLAEAKPDNMRLSDERGRARLGRESHDDEIDAWRRGWKAAGWGGGAKPVGEASEQGRGRRRLHDVKTAVSMAPNSSAARPAGARLKELG